MFVCRPGPSGKWTESRGDHTNRGHGLTVLRGPGLVFVGEHDCRVEEAEVDDASLNPAEVLVEAEVSVVSAGTEVANFTGLDPGPARPGAGTLIHTGPGTEPWDEWWPCLRARQYPGLTR